MTVILSGKHMQVLAVRQAPSLKKWRKFRRSCKQLFMLYQYPAPVSSNVLTSQMESRCIVFVGNLFFFRLKLT